MSRFFLISVLILTCVWSTGVENKGEAGVSEGIIIDKIWSAVTVGFCLYTHGENQYIAYYNADRQMVVGMRKLTDNTFTKYTLPSNSDKPPRVSRKSSTIQGWDSHNYITMTVDSEGYIHLSGNMHATPLMYFRSTKPGDVTSLVQLDSMVGKNEKRCTYPKFMTTTDGDLLYHYRDGGSGNGSEIYNVYDPETKTWSRFFDTLFIDGQGKNNAYQRGPVLGPDGSYHLLWLWRKTSAAETCHNISYARSPDMKQWENAAGEPLTLPITLQSKGTIIDPIPINGGILNTVHKFGFDSKDRVVVTYYKYDKDGNSQAYAARFDDGAWTISQLSDWNGRHVFKGGGSGPASYGTSLGLDSVKPYAPGKLALRFNHWKEGNGLLVFDEETLKPLGVEPLKPKSDPSPKGFSKVRSDFPGMQVKFAGDSGPTRIPGKRYVLRWETLGANRDKPRTGDLPENSDLILYELEN